MAFRFHGLPLSQQRRLAVLRVGLVGVGGGGVVRLRPQAVVHLADGLVLALVGVGAEEVTLRLHERRAGESLPPVHVEVRQGCGEGRARQACEHTQRHIVSRQKRVREG